MLSHKKRTFRLKNVSRYSGRKIFFFAHHGKRHKKKNDEQNL